VADTLLLDSSITIDHLRGHPDATAFLAPLFLRGRVSLHPVVLAELLSGARDLAHMRSIDASLRSIPVIRVRPNDFDTAMNLLRSFRLSTRIGWPDCLIAATALRLDVPFVTLNDKHFRPIRRLKLIRPY
jgi:tRNA(fMet)-specific endonuclease VapC